MKPFGRFVQRPLGMVELVHPLSQRLRLQFFPHDSHDARISFTMTTKTKAPRTRQDFTRYLRSVFDRIQAVHEADESEQIDIAAIVEQASIYACRFGAGDLIDPPHNAMTPREALVVIGRLLAWAEQNSGDYFDSSQAADYLGISGPSLYGLVERKQIVPLRGPRRTYRFTRKQLENYLAQGS